IRDAANRRVVEPLVERRGVDDGRVLGDLAVHRVADLDDEWLLWRRILPVQCLTNCKRQGEPVGGRHGRPLFRWPVPRSETGPDKASIVSACTRAGAAQPSGPTVPASPAATASSPVPRASGFSAIQSCSVMVSSRAWLPLYSPSTPSSAIMSMRRL